jgi:Na+/H+-dicarboxylate symporter
MKISRNSIIVLLLSVVCGIVTGYYPLFQKLAPIADATALLFQKSLKFLAIPLLFLSILSSFASMNTLKDFKILGKRLFVYTLITTIIAATIALILFITISPVQSYLQLKPPSDSESSFTTYLLDSFPDNIFTPFLEGNVFAVALLALFLGLSSLMISDDKRTVVKKGVSTLFDLFLQMTKGLLFLLPIAMWAFSYLFISQFNPEKGAPLLKYLSCILTANLIQGLVILPLFLKWKRLSPFHYAKAASPALICAFFTKSSNAALPLTLNCATSKLNIPQKVAKFALPLCSVINMNGCAAFILTTVFFVSGSYGIVFSPIQMILWVIIATFAAIGNAGVPMGCYFLSAALISSLGLPLEYLGLILPFYVLLDMFETALNVWSDICVTGCMQSDLAAAEAAQKKNLIFQNENP